jgi:hypothetical protein
MRYRIINRPRDGGVIMKSLDLSVLNSKKTAIVSSAEALREVTPINWSKSVLSGEKKVVVSCKK